MILIIDSGATNSSWKYIDQHENYHVEKLKGFNLSTTSIERFEIPNNLKRNKLVIGIFFFGAGTGSEEREF